MMPDTFEILATIRRLEKDRNWTLAVGALIAIGLLWWNSEIFSKGESTILAAVCIIGLLIFQEARNSHLQGLRVSLRHLELLRNPSIVHEW